MADSKKKSMFAESEVADESWMTTYSDMVTLLLTFFVLLVSMSTINMGMWQEFKEGYKAEVLAEEDVATPLGKMKLDLDSSLLLERIAGTVSIRLSRNSIEMNILSDELYEMGEAVINQGADDILQKILGAMDKIDYYRFSVEIEGHTDDVPINNRKYPSNWELSVARASGIVKYLISNGFATDRLKAAGYADTKPLAPNLDEGGNPLPDNRDINRRIVLRIK